MWQESNRSTHNHNTHKHTSPSPKLVPAVSVCCDRVASINQSTLTVISRWGHIVCEGVPRWRCADFKKGCNVNLFLWGAADFYWFITSRQTRGQDMHLRGSAAAARPAFKLTVLLEDMELRVLRLLASVTTMAEGKRDGWEYWGGSCLWEYTAKRM